MDISFEASVARRSAGEMHGRLEAGWRRGRAAALLAAWLLVPAAVLAADPARPPALPGGFPAGWEFRAGSYIHDPLSPEKGAADLNVEFLTPQLYRFSSPALEFIVPRLNAGTTISFNGKTSILYAGLAVDFNLTDALFVEGTLGGAFHNGTTGRFAVPGRNPMGCNAAFHESASVGYRFSPNWSVLATVEHTSNAGFCAQNRGLTNVGARIAYTF